MADHSDTATISLESLLHEIEATPREYWAEVLDTLRQFRQKISVSPQPVINAEQAKKNQAAINLLDSWIEEDDNLPELGLDELLPGITEPPESEVR
jgi:hypothetical protein